MTTSSGAAESVWILTNWRSRSALAGGLLAYDARKWPGAPTSASSGIRASNRGGAEGHRPPVLEGIADALQLTRVERDHVFLLAGGRRPETSHEPSPTRASVGFPTVSRTVPPTSRRRRGTSWRGTRPPGSSSRLPHIGDGRPMGLPSGFSTPTAAPRSGLSSNARLSGHRSPPGTPGLHLAQPRGPPGHRGRPPAPPTLPDQTTTGSASQGCGHWPGGDSRYPVPPGCGAGEPAALSPGAAGSE